MSRVYLERKDVPPALLAGFPGKKIMAVVSETVSINNGDGNWSEGSRTIWRAVRFEDGKALPLTDTVSAPWNRTAGSQTLPIPPGIVFLEEIEGYRPYLYIHVNPINAAKLLPAPAESLSPTDASVLNVICSLKSGYRQEEYRRMNLSPETVAASIAALKTLGYLNAAGAVTPAGRNARIRQ